MTRGCSAVILAAVLGAFGADPVWGQSPGEPPPRTTIWGSIALGAAGLADSGFYAASVGAGLQRRGLLLLGRAGSLSTGDRKRVEEFGLMAGIATRPAVIHAGVAAGLGAVRDSRDSTETALPLEARVTWRPARRAGIGVRLFGAVSRMADSGGVRVAVQLGRLRPSRGGRDGPVGAQCRRLTTSSAPPALA